MRSDELTPGYVTDLFSSFYPMTAASPAIAALGLVLYRDPARTAVEFERREPADGENWWRMVQLWDKIKAPFCRPCCRRFRRCCRRTGCCASSVPPTRLRWCSC